MGFLLLIVAVLLTSLVGSFAIVFTLFYYVITLRFKALLRALDGFFYTLALSIDQLGNVLCAVPFQYIFTKGDNALKFGNPDDTVSYVIAINQKRGTLTGMGKALAWVLDFVDKDHLQKAINNKIAADYEATLRLRNYEYYDKVH